MGVDRYFLGSAGQTTVVVGEFGERRGAELVGQRLLRRRPHPVQGAHVLPMARPPTKRALRGSDRTLKSLNDVEDTDVGRVAGQAVAAAPTGAGDHELAPL